MPSSVLVPTGTGKQGRAVVQELLSRGHTVHVLCRNPSSEAAKALESMGAVLHTGDLGSIDTIKAAMSHVTAVVLSIPAHPTDEVTFAKNVIDAAQDNKHVDTMVYTSVARVGEHERFPGWNDDYPLAWYWKNKYTIEHMVRHAEFQHWTIFRPAAFHQNFCRPMVDSMFPELAEGHQLRVAYHVDTRLDLISVADIAKFAAAAIESPARFTGREIGLAAEKLTAAQVAEQLSLMSGERITVEYIGDESAKELEALGHRSISAQVWQRDVGYGVDIGALEQYGIPLTPLVKALDKATLDW
jgi:uncharacterized protein YbjT (DUF2867 family)